MTRKKHTPLSPWCAAWARSSSYPIPWSAVTVGLPVCVIGEGAALELARRCWLCRIWGIVEDWYPRQWLTVEISMFVYPSMCSHTTWTAPLKLSQSTGRLLDAYAVSWESPRINQEYLLRHEYCEGSTAALSPMEYYICLRQLPLQRLYLAEEDWMCMYVFVSLCVYSSCSVASDNRLWRYARRSFMRGWYKLRALALYDV